jgi:leucyl aminopeptidase (aminopeptidase T)
MNNKKFAAFAAAGLGSILMIGSTGIANAADVMPSPSASATASATTIKGDPAKQALREANATARKAVHETFKAAMEKAKADFRAVLATNPTDTAKAAAVQARKAAVDAAKSAKVTAMLAINPNWTPHSKGDRPEKADKPAS